MTVVGIVDDVSDVDLLQPVQPTLYAAWTQTANVAFPMGLVLRTDGEPGGARAAAARRDRERGSAARAGSHPIARHVSCRVAGAADVPHRADAGPRRRRAPAGRDRDRRRHRQDHRRTHAGIRHPPRARVRRRGSLAARRVRAAADRAPGAALGVGLAAGSSRLLASLLPEIARFDGRWSLARWCCSPRRPRLPRFPASRVCV